MTITRAKEIVQTGFAWANWTPEQKEAFRTILLNGDTECEKAKQLSEENRKMTDRLLMLQEELEGKSKCKHYGTNDCMRCQYCNQS